MAISVADNLNLNQNELQNAVDQNLPSPPSTPKIGQRYFDTAIHHAFVWNGTIWEQASGATGGGTITSVTATGPLLNTGTATDPVIALKTGGQAGAANGISDTHIASDANIANNKLATNPLARANHTGTQLAATISDFDTQVRLSRLDQLAAPTADLNANNRKITGLADPVGAQDGANKNYVDTIANGVAWKDAVRVATTANGTFSTAFANGQTVDGVVLSTGDRILLKNQTTTSQNGIYIVQASGAPVRSTDADSSGDLLAAAAFISVGTQNASTSWANITPLPITVDTTALSWTQISGVGTIVAGPGVTITGNQVALTVPVPVNLGGTNATTAAAARANLAATTKLAFDVGDGTSTAIVLTHNANSRDVIIQVARATSPWDEVLCDIERTTLNTSTLRFSVAPTVGQFRATVMF